MSVLPIRIYGEPVLHERAKPVDEITDEIRQLAADMFETVDLAPGVGLAAPQIGVGLRMFVYTYTDEVSGTSWRDVAINPELLISPAVPESIVDLGEHEEEGCLSFPGERYPIRRAARAHMRATNLDGEQYELDVEGWMARILQHEYDHLNGVIYVDRLSHPHQRDAFKVMRKRSWGGPGQSWMPGEDNLEG